ncbi:MAG TPA: TldD/PmbA family protein, partial [Candidatus Lokiarchaeia archaeon]
METNLTNNLIKELIKIASNKISYWDIRIGRSIGTNLDFTDQKSKEVSSFEISDCGIRTFYNGGWGFTVIKDITKESILEGFSKAVKLAKLSESFCKNKFSIKETDPIIKNFKIESKKDLNDIDIKDKVDVVKDHEKKSASYSKEIKNTRTVYTDGKIYSTFANSTGSYISQELSLLRIFSLVFAQKNGVLQKAVNSIGGIGGFEIATTEQANNLSLKSAKEAVDLLDAKSPIGGNFTLIMDPKLTGTFVHEAFGHACEADLVLNKESILEGKVGEKLALESVNIVDNPIMGQGKKFKLPYELFGSYFIDDEGIPAQKTILIEKGILKNYLHNVEPSSRMNLLPNGHGRAMSNSSRPQVRMGITILEPGDWSLEEMIEDTKKGILC